MGQSEHDPGAKGKPAWNAGRELGAKRALKPQQVRAIRFWLDSKQRMRDRAMFDLATDSKLRGCDIDPLGLESSSEGGTSAAVADAVWPSAEPLTVGEGLGQQGRLSQPLCWPHRL